MNLSADDVLEIARHGEGRDVEFKRGLPPAAKIGRTLCAFANTRGGMLLVGITDRGEVYGVDEPRAIVAALRAACRQQLEPPVKAELATVKLGAKRVVCCSIPLSPARPHHLRKADDSRELVVRVGSSNRVATGATLEALRRPRGAKSASPLEKKVLAWARGQSPRAVNAGATVQGFARAHNVGLQRARRAFVALERAGRLVGHGFGARRVYQAT